MEKVLYYRIDPKFNDNYVVIKRELYRKGINYFSTEEEAVKHYKKAYKIAIEKHSQIMEAIAEIKENIIDFKFDYYMEGDTFGIYEDGSYIGITVNGYDFKFKNSGRNSY